VQGNIVTIEPGIYLPGKFGVRIEDMVYLGADGKRNLTNFPKELLIL
jgi:Xaa-Pro aminopeptidase